MEIPQNEARHTVFRAEKDGAHVDRPITFHHATRFRQGVKHFHVGIWVPNTFVLSDLSFFVKPPGLFPTILPQRDTTD